MAKIGGVIPLPLVVIVGAAVALSVVAASIDRRHDKTGAPEAMAHDAATERLVPVSFVAASEKSARIIQFRHGHAVYDETCHACHEDGIAGAPRLGDKAAWGPRIAKGFPTLVGHAVKGFQGKDGIMPPKGGGAWDEVEVARAVAWMTSRAGGSFAEPDSLPVR
jgi:cytochrome c5